MDAVGSPLPFALPEDWAIRTGRPRPSRHLWPVMGDIATSRAGVPELLIQWRRAEGDADPDPQL